MMDSFEAPTIASDIWQSTSSDTIQREGSAAIAHDNFKTGSKAIDDAFHGGLQYGTIHCITSKAEDGVRDLVLALLATHLLSSSHATATITDSTLAFDVRRLHALIQSSLPAGEDAMQALGRLKISTVFDRIGITEAVAELRDELDQERHDEAQQSHAATTATETRRCTIEDGEVEAEARLDHVPKQSVIETLAPAFAGKGTARTARLLVIDNISRIFVPIIKNDYARGQALLTSFMQHIQDVTRRHQLCTVVAGEAAFQLVSEDETLSRFKSCRIKPAVGYGIGYLVDVHLYLHRVAKGGAAKDADSRAREVVHVLEIVEERSGDRQGCWAPFRFSAEGKLEDVV